VAEHHPPAGAGGGGVNIDPLGAMGRVLEFPRRGVDGPGGVVDDWGRDPGLVHQMTLLAQLRWSVTVGGEEHLPRRKGALIVVNTRRFALAPIFTAFAIGEAVDRPVHFVGRSDTAPLGPLGRRIGGLLDHPDEVFGALRAGGLVVLGAEASTGLRQVRDVGRIRHEHVGAATAAGVQVYPTATMSSPFGRNARVEIGQATRPSRRRRGPLAELELADHLRAQIVRLLGEMGEIRTGTPIDWLPLSGLGGH
jgi:hypothetical protein